jgi:putative transposase
VVFYRRDLPHWHPDGVSLFITWRLFGSLPANMRRPAVDESAGEQFARLDRVMDRAAIGPTWLRDPRVAGCVVAALAHGAAKLRQFHLHAYVVMPNHVHVLLTTAAALRVLTKGIKGTSARQANAILGRSGERFWQIESYDHWVRDAVEYRRICRYIERNPVSAGLATNAEDWRWSSASSEGKGIVTPLLLAR